MALLLPLWIKLIALGIALVDRAYHEWEWRR
jgi:hypothetical protein